MIASGLQKFARENGLQIGSGVGYGSLRGFAVTLSEGAEYKKAVFTTVFSDPVQKEALLSAVNAVDSKQLYNDYRVQSINVTPKAIQVIFHDKPGTMKKIEAFMDWFIPLLEQYGASKADICAECGGQLTAGCWKLVDGIAYHLHESCAERVRNQVAAANENRKQEAEGSYALGMVGALLGSLLGSVVWAIVLSFGYVASLVGLLIGWLSEKGYTLLHGKQGKGKIVILIIAIILGVLIGTVSADVVTLVTMINDGDIDLAYGEIPLFMLLLFMEDSEYATATISNVLMGLLFAGLGVFALLKKAGKEVADTKFVDLK